MSSFIMCSQVLLYLYSFIYEKKIAMDLNRTMGRFLKISYLNQKEDSIVDVLMDIDVNRTMGRFLKISYLNQKGGFTVVLL